MHATPPLPLFKRVSPGIWTALTWCAATLYSLTTSVRLPGEARGLFMRQGPLLAPPNWMLLVECTVLTLAGSALLRRRPLPALALLLAGSVAGAMAMNGTRIGFPQFLAVDVAVGFIAATGAGGAGHTTGLRVASGPGDASGSRASIGAAAMALGVVVGYPVARLAFGFVIGTTTELAVALTVLVAWLIGNSARQTRDYAERLGAQAAAQAVTTERLRIARELHDMVAHSIGIIALQAGAASRVIETQPARARAALSEVETAARETLSGLRRMLGALRQADRGPGGWSEAAALQPMPGLADVEQLAAKTTAAGVRVDVEWQGERRPIPPEIDLSAFRIIQESVTNVVRHSGTRSCRVSIDHRDEELSIEIVDNGHSRSGTSGTGYGLVGMRERAALLQGDFSAEPRPGGGFRVAARLPLPEAVR